ncbi:hypothetical protein [Paractinoplanes maris]|uniref:hypothetical protein n=1 Tax=Paractinoplanes maris TaxID=1734446 RepID=UPI002021BAD0|nr:hypothetical protein [Actinoplanes maris]
MPWIELKRAHDVGAIARRMTFRVDGRLVARLRRGATARIEVPAGRHTVQARMDWQRSEPLELDLSDDTLVTLTGALTEHSMTFTGTFRHPRTALELLVT